MYSIILLGILSVGLLSAFLLGPNVKNSLVSKNKELGATNSDGTPLRSKTLKDNGDGTYTIALDVTGDSSKVQTTKANVIVIIDRSGSMGENTGNTEVTYTASNQTAETMYGLVDGQYVLLTRRNTGSYYRPSYHYYYNNVEYTGQRYLRQQANQTRMDAAKDAANELAYSLLSKNGVDGAPNDLFEVALVSFSTSASSNNPTTTYSTFETQVNGLNANGGTNWEAALDEAADITFSNDAADTQNNIKNNTYVIFVSDGKPTFHTTDGGYGDWNRTYSQYGTGQEGATNVENCYNEAVDDAQALATKVGVGNFYTIFAYGEESGSNMLKQLTTDAGAPEGNFYNASNTAALQEAFNDILSKIETEGFADVEITDGTTAAVQASSGSVSGGLLEVDQDSYKYWLSFPLNSDGQSAIEEITNITHVSGDQYKLTNKAGNEYTVTRVPAYEKDMETGRETNTVLDNVFKFEWSKDNYANNPFHQITPPEATYDDDKDSETYGAVDWDLSSLNVLYKDVTYTVTFDCYPSQVTLDLIADIKNDPTVYNTLDPSVQLYLKADGTLLTNTEASLKYDDTRTLVDESTGDPVPFNEVEPVETKTVDVLSVSKKWDGGTPDPSIILYVDRDNDTKKYFTELTGPDYEGTVSASIGILKYDDEGNVKILVQGHDYKFSEDNELSHVWEFTTPTVRPMMINGEVKTLMLETKNVTMTKDHEMIDGKEYFRLNIKDGETTTTKIYYVGSDSAKLTATNVQRSHLDFNKTVTGEDKANADPDQLFTFDANIKTATGVDYWFSIWNGEGYVINDTTSYITGATQEVVVIDTNDTTNVADTQLDLTNNRITYKLRNEITHEFEEKSYSVTSYTLEDGVYTVITGFYYAPSESTVTFNIKEGWNVRFTYVPTGSEYTITEKNLPTGYQFTEVTGNGTADGMSVSGTLSEASVTYEDKFFNEYALTHVDVEKVWNDNDDQDGKRPDSLDIVLNQNGEEYDRITLDGETEDDEIETVAWHATFDNLPVYDDDGNKYTYEAYEDFSSNDYTSTKSGNAKAGYVFTNTHTPETADITVVKAWEDNDDQDGKRPESVEFQLKADGENYGDPVTLTEAEDGSWTYTFEDLDVYADGEEIIYTVEETSVPANYTKVTSEANPNGVGNKANNYTVTNAHTPETADVTVTKVWDDEDNYEGFRPDSVSIKLYANGEEVGTAVVAPVEDKNTEDTWTYTFEDLDVYAGGEEIDYTIEEIEVPHYESEYNQDTLTVTNSRDVEKVDITVTKVWEDADNKEGYRPDSVTFNLFGADEEPMSITLSDASDKDEKGNWTYTFEDLDVYANGEEIEYSLEEVKTAVITGTDGTGTYAYTVSGDKEEGFVVTNTHTPEETSVTVEKKWEDANDKEGFRPTSVQVQLKDETGNVGDPITLDESNNWKYEWTELQKYRNKEEIEYTVEEVTTDVITGTDSTGTYKIDVEETETGYKITNTHTPEETSVTVEKKWEDANDKEGFRPTSVQVQLKDETGNVGDPITLDESNNWKYEWTELQKYRNKEEIEYTVEEVKTNVITGTDGIGTYKIDVEETTTGYKITNTHTPVAIEVEVEKVWNDSDDVDGFRPDSITVILHASDSSIEDQSKTFGGTGNTWSTTFTDLLAYKDGKKVTYTVEEVTDETVITGKDGEKTYAVKVEETTTGYKITNTHTPVLTTSTVEKVWDDNSDQDRVRPETDELTFQLKADGENVGEPVTLTDKGNNKWSYTAENLPKYNDGKLIKYTWTEDEDSLPEGYKLTSTVESEDGLKVTLTNHRDTDKVTINGKKVWDDADNNDKVRPTAGLDIQLFADGDPEGDPIHVDYSDENEWNFSFPNLEANKDGEEIVYTVDEVEVPEYYEKVSAGNEENGYTITNKHTKETTSVSVKKVWDDDDNRDAIRPETIQVQLKANGDVVGSKVLPDPETGKLETTFTGLDKLYNGDEIEYTVEEVKTSVVTGTDSATTYAINVTGDQEKGYTITNTHTPIKTQIDIEKVWDDDDNRDVLRPEKITVNLYQDGSKTPYRSETVTYEESIQENTWYYSFTDLPKYKNVDGKAVEIQYTIDENKVTDYDGTVDGLTITNFHKPVTTEISGYKAWYDDSNRDGKRPTKVTIQLYAGDTLYDSQEIEGTGNEWNYTFKDLPTYENVDGERKEVVYSVKEVNVPEGYTSAIDGKDKFVINNTYETAKTSLSGEKIWDDDSNRDGVRLSEVTIVLNADGTPLEGEQYTKTVSAATDWKYSWTGLPKYRDGGKEIVYSVTEELSEADAKLYTPNPVVDGNKLNIKNTHTPSKISINGTKAWDDADDQDGKRPETVTINLLANGTKVESTTATKDGGWTYSFTDLYEYEAGKKIEYTVTEEAVDGYEAEIDGYTVTNIHIPEKVSYTVNKVWDDDDDRDGIRPKSITVNLLADGVKVDSKKVTAADNWSTTFTDLDKYSGGKLIAYSITEEIEKGYSSSVTKIDENTTSVTITNTHTPTPADITIIKTWEGDEDHLDQRPTYITVKIYADGVYVDSITVRAEDDWKYIVENLYKYKGGVEIKYTIEEDAVEGYITNYNGFEIINTRDSSGDVVPDEEPPHTSVDFTNIYEFIVTGLAGAALLYRREY